MLNRSKRLAGLVAVAAASLLVAAACSSGGGKGTTNPDNFSPGFAECLTKPNNCNSGPRKAGGTLVFAVEQDMASWHINSADGSHFSSSQMLSGLIPSPFTVMPDLSVQLNKDLMVSAEQTSTSPQTIVYKISPNAIWSDGTQITADDFLFNLYTFDGKSCKDCTPAATSGYDQIKEGTSSDNGKTLTIVFDTPFPDWKGLFSLYPAHIAKQAGWTGTKEDAAGLAKAFNAFIATQMTWSGGPYMIEKYEKGVALTEVANPKWYGKEKPTLDKLVWRLVEQQSELIPALRNGEINGAYPQPSVDLVTQAQELTTSQFQLASGAVWEHFDINTKNTFLADKALRQAIFTAVDRNEIITKTVGVFAKDIKPLGNHVLFPTQKGYSDEIGAAKQGAGDVEAAKKILTDAGYTGVGTKLVNKAGQAVPAFRFRHTVGNKLRADTAALFQAQMKKLGVDIKIETTDALSRTLSTGDYDIMIFAWVGSPLIGSNLKDLWSTNSGQNYNKHSNPAYDSIAEEAAKTVDEAKFLDLVKQGVKILTEDAVVLPLFQKPNMLIVYKDYVNIRGNATNAGPAYNNQEWGLKAA
jgi:peptide/nickel transport system substrate-binding protein